MVFHVPPCQVLSSTILMVKTGVINEKIMVSTVPLSELWLCLKRFCCRKMQMNLRGTTKIHSDQLLKKQIGRLWKLRNQSIKIELWNT